MTPWQLFHVIAFIVAKKGALSRDVLLRGEAFVRIRNGLLERVVVDGGVRRTGAGGLVSWWR